MNVSASDIIWFIFIGAMFVMMFRRGGCCGGHRHKEHKHEDSEGNTDHKQLN